MKFPQKRVTEVKLSYKELETLKELRLNLSKAEGLLWDELKHKKGAAKFRKKYTVGSFLVDYVCLAKNTIVEFSGKEDETERTTFFAKEGFNIVRFSNEEVIENVLQVVSKINNTLQFSSAIKSDKNLEKKPTKKHQIDVFTTRPDTIFGVSFMTLAPEHELVSKISNSCSKKGSKRLCKSNCKAF